MAEQKKVFSKAAPKKADKKEKMYAATKTPLKHPFQKKLIALTPTEGLEMDSWMECQIEAGLIKEC